MGLMDAITGETKIETKYKDFYTLTKNAAIAELMLNAVNCNVPHEYIRETMTGVQEEHPENTEDERKAKDEYETTISAARSLFAEFDEAGVKVAADSLRRIICIAEKERLDNIILENSRKLRERDKEMKREELVDSETEEIHKTEEEGENA